MPAQKLGFTTMLRVDLGQLRREGSVLLEARVPSDDGLWHDSELSWAGDVDIRLTASFAGTGEVVVRGRVRGTLDQECRRCLRPVTTDFEREMTMVFVSEEDAGEAEDADAYVFEPTGAHLDLSSAVREELILAVDRYVVCDPECKGLCPTCGADLNEGPCGCKSEETDPRWEALRILKEE
jgi:uncharacterized protein